MNTNDLRSKAYAAETQEKHAEEEFKRLRALRQEAVRAYNEAAARDAGIEIGKTIVEHPAEWAWDLITKRSVVIGASLHGPRGDEVEQGLEGPRRPYLRDREVPDHGRGAQCRLIARPRAAAAAAAAALTTMRPSSPAPRPP